MIIIGVTAIIIVLIISVSVAVITHNSTVNNTTNNTTVNTTTNNTTVNATNNTTSNNTNSTTSKSSSKKSKTSKSSDDGYHYSDEYGTYIKEWDDGHGNSYMRSKNGEFYEHYNEKTGFYETNYPGEGYVHN